MAEIPAAVEAELTWLRAENARLLRLLKMTPEQAAPPGPGQAAFFEGADGAEMRKEGWRLLLERLATELMA